MFIEQLTEDSAQGTDGLADAVNGYVSYVTDRSKNIDFRLAITTTTVDYSGGANDGIEPGEAGTLIGTPAVVDKFGDYDVTEKFQANLLCNATYWDFNQLEQDPSYQCGDPVDEIHVNYLDCLCGEDGWDNPSGSGREEPLEAALMALCRSVEEPPDVCYESGSPFGSGDVGANAGFLRDDSAIFVVIVGDEGDDSRRMQMGDEDPEPYLDAFARFERRIKFVTVGPNIIPNESGTGYSMPCNSGSARDWAAIRLQNITAETQGFYRPLEVQDGENCQISAFNEYLEELGTLLSSLSTVFRLQSVPDVSSILVYVNGDEVAEASALEVTESGDVLSYGNGWIYESAENAVVFKGNAVPDYGQDVRIYYRPLAGTPRDVPFCFDGSTADHCP